MIEFPRNSGNTSNLKGYSNNKTKDKMSTVYIIDIIF